MLIVTDCCYGHGNPHGDICFTTLHGVVKQGTFITNYDYYYVVYNIFPNKIITCKCNAYPRFQTVCVLAHTSSQILVPILWNFCDRPDS